MATRRSLLTLLRAAAAAAAPAGGVPALAPARLLHPVVTTLPSLLGWQPAAALQPPLQHQQQRVQQGAGLHSHAADARGSSSARGAQHPAALLSRRGHSSLSDSIRITPAIEGRLEQIQQRHADLLQQLSGDAMSQLTPADMARLNKELSDLEPVVDSIQLLQAKRQELEGLQALVDDAGEDEEMRRMAREERGALLEELPGLERELLLQLLPKDADDERGVVLEVRAGTGGDEACLFALELFRMYERFAAAQGWRFEVMELAESDLGGCKLASAAIAGAGGVYGQLKWESGIHRVQRVPVTESGGRVHTSAASVAVLPEAGDLDVTIRDEDIRIDTYRSGGAGGQHVNTTDSAVRITHLPTGLVVAIQDERSQHKNKAKALKVLRARLYEAERARAAAAASAERKALIGSGDRSERIRTYNFPQGRVTDHRVGVTEHGMDGVLGGERLGVFIEALRLHHQTQALASLEGGGA